MPKRMTHKEFVEKVKNQHPSLEVLSEYNGNKGYVTVRCTIHDYVFKTKPNWLNKGNGCQKCYDDRRNVISRKTTEQFIEEARQVHGNKYDYSKVDYINNKTKVCIICPIHGGFWQTPGKHLNSKHGCPKCGIEDNRVNRMLSQEEFIEKCNKTHNDKYSYINTVYKGVDHDIDIICPIHGEFKQNAYAHSIGCGCPKCSQSKLETSVEQILKELNIEYIPQYQFKELGRQSLDFYLPQYNIGIECQGGQHFESVEHFGGDDGLIQIQERDYKKYNICKDNNIRLLYIYPRKYSNMINRLIESNQSIYSFDNIGSIDELNELIFFQNK